MEILAKASRPHYVFKFIPWGYVCALPAESKFIGETCVNSKQGGCEGVCEKLREAKKLEVTIQSPKL